jgi:uncharacterized protein (TIGR00725 family)
MRHFGLARVPAMNVPAPTLFLDRARGCLHDGAGLLFDGAAHAWRGAPGVATRLAGDPIDPVTAVRWLQRESGTPSRPTIGVVGGRHGTHPQLAAARALGEALADVGLVVLCGGRRGVMLAVCEGVAARGGISVGLLPGDSIADGNPLVTIPLPTGIGLARNALIARAAQCLVAIGGSHGTLSEMAFGMQFGKRVFALEGAPYVEGCEVVADVAAAINAIARVVLALDGEVALPYVRDEA